MFEGLEGLLDQGDLPDVSDRRKVDFSAVLDDEKNKPRKWMYLRTPTDVRAEQVRIYRAVRRGRMTLAQGRGLFKLLRDILDAMDAGGKLIDAPTAGPGPERIPAIARIIEHVERARAEGDTAGALPE